MTEPEIVILPDPSAVAASAAAHIASALGRAVAARGRADLATTGGSTPVGIYRGLAGDPLRDAVPWADVHVWWGDDRYVPRADPLSNVKPLDDILLGEGRIALPDSNLHPFPMDAAIAASRGPEGAAIAISDELARAGLDVADGWPVLDLVLLGVGGDGHILSVFPDSDAFHSRDWALAIPAPAHIEPHVARATLNPAVVTWARTVLAVAHGSGKAEVIARILHGQRDPSALPAQLARRTGATWILDEAAAAGLGA